MSITRAPRPDTGFYILDKKISEDKRLSWAARGLLVYLLGKPDYWQVSTQALINETSGSRVHSGRDAVRAVIKELIEAGYITRKLKRGGDAGRLSGYEYSVSEVPTPPEPENPSPVEPEPELPEPDYPSPVEPEPVNPPQVSNETSTSNEVKKVLNPSSPIGGQIPGGSCKSAAKKPAPTPEYSTEFDDAWAVYPKRAGGNPKRAAYKAWNARINAGATAAQLLDGVMRYATYIHATGKTGTEFVKQAATFFGADLYYLEPWDIAGIERRGGKPSPHTLPDASKYGTGTHVEVPPEGLNYDGLY